MSLDTDVLIIGAGMSGLGFAIQLQTDFPQASYEIIEKSDGFGGTWWANTYPGCGCDVPSHVYSYSFDLKPDWSMKYALQPEILAYFRSVVEKYNITQHIRYNSMVQTAVFDEKSGTWQVVVLDRKTNLLRHRRCKILISAVGALSIPKECDIKGSDKFRGKLFHSAQWDHQFNWADKDVIVVGNGCSATQFVPIMTGGGNKVRKLTQFIRQPHWVIERPNPQYSPLFKWIMRYVPLAMRSYRAWHFSWLEYSFREFYLESGRKLREDQTVTHLDYMRRTAPAKYHDVLTPKIEFGCKRKVMDTDYFACLHRENMELVATDPIEEITETGVITKSGKAVDADAIVLANGFQTQQVLYPLDIKGEKGISLTEHWENFAGNTPQAYFGTCVSGFPNFFIMMGPNTATGHLSVIYTSECQINFTIRAIRPVMQSLYPSPLLDLNPFGRKPCDTVAVTPAAEREDNSWVQSALKGFVWASGCSNWYVDEKTGKNTMLYPDWQLKYWLRSIFVPFSSDFEFKSSEVQVVGTNHGRGDKSYQKSVLVGSGLGLALVATFAAGLKYDLKVRDLGFKESHHLGYVVKDLVRQLISSK
ncbi:4-hydroxyacetophenone monooxygenase [Arthroderma uncinatum]|uniref:4-hydroxyacetophenone monooxygenase n=1 Tax=Arthroderma uncinatum TaxID=74035 RepID=UPI00144AE089|nr:4-hydroxyacetophenone monooxygenase [Arthroderma uncinatum]KAF3484047.1 4-hydroxyacetophenone monooxygenase [Arthroderma uncinatum]